MAKLCFSSLFCPDALDFRPNLPGKPRFIGFSIFPGQILPHTAPHVSSICLLSEGFARPAQGKWNDCISFSLQTVCKQFLRNICLPAARRTSSSGPPHRRRTRIAERIALDAESELESESSEPTTYIKKCWSYTEYLAKKMEDETEAETKAELESVDGSIAPRTIKLA